jgi:hypothetical protein
VWHKHSATETESAGKRWAREHPFGDEGSVDYWIEAMKRAVQLGEMRAQEELGKLIALEGPQPPRPYYSFPDWFQTLWTQSLASYNDGRCRLAMPY